MVCRFPSEEMIHPRLRETPLRLRVEGEKDNSASYKIPQKARDCNRRVMWRAFPADDKRDNFVHHLQWDSFNMTTFFHFQTLGYCHLIYMIVNTSPKERFLARVNDLQINFIITHLHRLLSVRYSQTYQIQKLVQGSESKESSLWISFYSSKRDTLTTHNSL